MKKHSIKVNGYFYNILSNYKTYVDSNIFLNESTAKNWKKVLVRRLAVADKKFIVISSVLNELKRKTVSGDLSLAARAKKALVDINNMVEQGLCELEIDDMQMGLADANFLELFSRKRFRENLLLVTRDHKLAQDILKMNDFSSAKSYREILVWRMGDDGLLDSRYDWFPKKPHLKEMVSEPNDRITCCDCDKPFDMTLSEKRSYLKKGLCIPKRCPDCRQKKREMANQSSSEPPKLTANSSNSSSGCSSGGGLALPGFWGTGLGDIVGALLL